MANDNSIVIKVSLDGAQEEIDNLAKIQKGIDKLAQETKSLKKAEKDLAKAYKDGEKTQEEYTQQLKEVNAQQVENKAELKLNRAAYRENERQVINNTKANKLNEGSLVQLRAQLSKDTFAYDRLSKAERDNANIGGVLQKSIDAQSAKLKELEGQTGRNQRNVGNYAGSLKGLKEELNKNIQKFQELTLAERKNDQIGGKLSQTINKQRTEINNINKTLNKTTNTTNVYKKSFGSLRSVMLKGLGALGITAGLAGLVNVLKGATKIAKDFEQGNANLAAVLGKSRKEITELTEDAKRLGASTSFTASQVSELQTEFAKLGFNEKEILNATEATLDLAAATGSDLGEAAAIAGATLGGFGLDATETQRVTDVMAKSFSSSALDIEKFRESMKSAAPAARAIGVDVEETTALLGTLANAGVSGSMAGTALRKSFIELNAAGLTLDEGLAQVANSEDKLGAATDLVGKKAASSFLILAEGQKDIKELEVGLNSAGGAAKKMADEQLNTLEGQTKILNSAWEGLVLSLLSGDSAFNSIAKSIVESATGALTFLTNTEKLSDSLEEERQELYATEAQLLSSNTTQEERVAIIQKLQAQYPKYLSNIDAETVSNEDLVVALKKVNDELVNKIIIQRQQEKIDEQNEKVADKRELQLKAQATLVKQLEKATRNNEKAREIFRNGDLKDIEKAEQIIGLLDKRGTLQTSLTSGAGGFASAQTVSASATEKLSRAISGLRSANELLSEEEEGIKALLNDKQDLMQSLGLESDSLTESTKESTEATTENTEAINDENAATTSLIEKQKELKKLAQDLPETTEAEIAAKNAKIEVIDKEIARLKSLGKTEKENAKDGDKKDKEELDKKKKAIDDEIKILQLKRDLELATVDETNEQKLQKEKELLDKIAALRIEKAELNDENLTAVKLENKIAAAELEAEVDAGIEEKKREKETENEDFKRELRSETENLAVEGGKALVNAAQAKADREKDIELASLNARLEAGTISQEEFEASKLAIEKKAFAKKKKLDLAVVAIDLAKELSAISAAAAANPANAVTFGAAGVSQAAVLSGIAIAKSGVQAAVIASQKFAQGGVIHGASHANGGVNVRVGGSGMIEAEGGEAIINKKSTSKHLGLLSAINQDGGGVPLAASGMVTPNVSTLARFGNGGVATAAAAQVQPLDMEELRQAFSDSINTIKVQNVASETTGVSNRVEQIQDSASF